MSNPTRSRRNTGSSRPGSLHVGEQFNLGQLAEDGADDDGGQVVQTLSRSWLTVPSGSTTHDPGGVSHSLAANSAGSGANIRLASSPQMTLSPALSKSKLRKLHSTSDTQGQGSWRRRSFGRTSTPSRNPNHASGGAGGGGGGGSAGGGELGELGDPVIHLADLGKRHTKDIRVSEAEKLRKASEAEKLRKAVLRGGVSGGMGGHSNQPSMSSRPSSDSHQPLWLGKDVWVTEINEIDNAMVNLETQYKSGEMRAFGQNSQWVFKELDQLRIQQQELFHKHIDMEKSVVLDLGHEVPEVETMVEHGFEAYGNEESSQTAMGLLDDVNKLCEDIQRTTFDDTGAAQFMSNHGSKSGDVGSHTGTHAGNPPAQPSPQPLTREALAQLPRK